MDPPPPPQPPPPPSLTNPRFTLELEFVLSLANPYYLSHLAISFPNLLGTSTVDEKGDEDSDEAALSTSASGKEARAFQAYLAYLYSYWKTPEYAQFLTHPGATLRALRLLQEESFRRDIIRPQVIESLLDTRAEDAQATGTAPENESTVENSNETQAS
jgi:mediator of RNA polymerase II transcription subunit 31